MIKNDIINFEELKENLSCDYKFLNISSLIYRKINRNPFLSLIKEKSHFYPKEELSYDLEISFNYSELKKDIKNSRLSLELEAIKKQCLEEGNEELNTFLIKVLHTNQIPILAYNNFYSEMKEKVITIKNLEEILTYSSKELSKQQAWNEWNNSYKGSEKGILAQIREKGIYIKSPFWQYDKALNIIFDALDPKENNSFFILSSPSTYHQVLKKKILINYQNEISQDSWDYKGKAYIPILSIPEIPNTGIIIANPKDFTRWVKRPFLVEIKEEQELILGRGSFSDELLKKDSSAYIELYLD